MGWWSNLKSGKMWDTVTDYAVPDFIYNQGTGGWFGDDPEARKKLKELAGQAPPPIDPAQYSELLAGLNRLSGVPSGAGYQQTPYYKSLMQDVEQRDRRMGWGNAAQQGRSGVVSAAGYGPAQALGTERGEAYMRTRTAASGQAYQAQVQAQAAEFQRVLATAGFTVGINDASWEQKFRVWAAQVGLAQGQVEAAVQRQRMIFDLLGQAALAYAVYSGAGKGKVGGGSGPTGEVGGGILPSSVG